MTMTRTNIAKPFPVVQSLPIWLPFTSPWLFRQVTKLPRDIVPHIVCLKTDNLDQFGIPNLHSLASYRLRYRWEYFMRRLRGRRQFSFLMDVIRNTNSRVVHSHWGDAAWWDVPSVQRTDAKHVVTFYGKEVNFIPKRNPRWVERYNELFLCADAVLCEGPHMAKCIVNLGCPKAKVHVHHLGVEVERIAFRPRQWMPNEPLRVLIAASFREKKGIPLAIAALGRLKHKVRALEVTVIGDSSADPRSVSEKERIVSAIKENSLTNCVRMMGYQPYEVLIREAYRHHVFLSPSLTAADGDTEGGAPIVLLDMAATGMPIVSSTHCDIPNLIVDGLTGLLSEEGDVESLVQKLQLLVQQADSWGAMVSQGRARVEDAFNATTQASVLADIYKGLIQ